ncbi:hypothetical protein [Hyphomicrobium sp.]|uniref:hypothetical protein n=1 Tax=Hyphomicrobium sp. TaxID=82 RepID=UPI0025B82D64|nr:hypothetical protein [Hyphomicrobium sp.]MCC7252310.1 hypothetical protein [Hyphomicrobium sp.]
MTRTILSLATALFAATALTSAAEACISCEYVPEVVHSKPAGTKTYTKKRIHAAGKERAAPSKRVVKTQTVKKVDTTKKVETAKKAEPAAKVETVETAPAAETTSERGRVSTATLLEMGGRAQTEEPEATTDAGCTKFFPATGQVMQVPCE